MPTSDINTIKNVHRIENCPLPKMNSLANELTHTVYPHDEIYGNYCSIEEYINCPPEMVFEYLANGYNLAEWTYSLRDFEEAAFPDQLLAFDKIGTGTKIFCKTFSNKDAMTVDYHCAWDQDNELWMIYLMRVVPAELVLKKPGSVVLWTNCRHPYYDQNPFPDTAPADRKTWVGDLWPFFYAGHYVEMQNLKHILEHRFQAQR